MLLADSFVFVVVILLFLIMLLYVVVFIAEIMLLLLGEGENDVTDIALIEWFNDRVGFDGCGDLLFKIASPFLL